MLDSSEIIFHSLNITLYLFKDNLELAVFFSFIVGLIYSFPNPCWGTAISVRLLPDQQGTITTIRLLFYKEKPKKPDKVREGFGCARCPAYPSPQPSLFRKVGFHPIPEGDPMKVTYDPEVDVLHIVLSDVPIMATDRNKPGVIIDYDHDGNLIGLEILEASMRVENPRVLEYAVMA
jgi:uncharacterized protein YuzE